MKKLTKEIFINESKEIHGDKYDYSKVEYVNNSTKVCINCPEHGEFWQRPNDHLKGHGCPMCGGVKKLTTESFIEKSKLIHGDRYDYSKVNYVGNKIKVCIICPEHGEFWQIPNGHLNGQGCPNCVKNKKLTLESFIDKAKVIHQNKYDYSKVEYKNTTTKVCIICPEHGEFWQRPSDHLKGHGCQMCKVKNHILKSTLTTTEFVERAKKIHDNKYDYSKVDYKGSKKSVCIICPIHGEFWQIPNYHIDGCGCPICAAEKNINSDKLYKMLLENTKYNICREKHFRWLKNKNEMSLDFYIQEKKIAIEYQGEQHFKAVAFFGGEKTFDKQLERDLLKYNLCKEHGIKLLYFTFKKRDITDNVWYNTITDFNELITIIENG